MSNEMNFDPMTGKPIVNNDSPVRKQIGFDPMTGEPVYEEEPAPRKQVGFDPMTGEPVYEEDPVPKKQVGFDPMTGEPVYESAPEFSSGTNKPGKKGLNLKILIPVACVCLVLIAGIVVFAKSVLGSPAVKVASALKNTFKGEKIVESLMDLSEFSDSNTFTVNGVIGEGDMYVSFNAGAEISSKNFEVSADADVQLDSVTGAAYLYMNDEYIAVDSPDYLDSAIGYTFSPDGGDYGDFIQELDSEAEFEMIDEAVNAAVDLCKSREDIQKKAEKIILSQLKELEFEKLKKEEIEIGRDDVKCSGYEVEVDGDWLADTYEMILDVVEEEGGDAIEILSDYGYYEIEDMVDELSYIEDFTIRFWIKSNKVLAIDVETSGEEVRVAFAGDKAPWHEIILYADDEELASLEASVDGKVEEFDLKAGGTKVGTFEYNTSTGEFELSSDSLYESIEGTLLISKKELSFYFDYDGVSVDMTISKDANIAVIDRGDMLDIRTATMDEMNTFADNLYDLLYKY